MEPDDPSMRSWWRGRLPERVAPEPLTLRAPLEVASSSHAGAFSGLADDGKIYWIKLPGNPQGDQILTNEYVVGKLAQELGVPAPDPRTVLVRADLFNARENGPRWHGVRARIQGDVLAHASPLVTGAVEHQGEALEYVDLDDNRVRHARIIGLWDLCMGNDAQWLYSSVSDQSVWTFDHGFWFDSNEGDWGESSLALLLDRPFELDTGTRGLADELRRFAGDLETLRTELLIRVLSGVPRAWGCSDADLEALGWFLWSRRSAVAGRLRRRAQSASG